VRARARARVRACVPVPVPVPVYGACACGACACVCVCVESREARNRWIDPRPFGDIRLYLLLHLVAARFARPLATNVSTFSDIERVMGWLRLVGSLKLQVSFAEYRLFYRALLQKRPVILKSLLIVATPYVSDSLTFLQYTSRPFPPSFATYESFFSTVCAGGCVVCDVVLHLVLHLLLHLVRVSLIRNGGQCPPV